MLAAAMPRRANPRLLALVVAAAALGAGGCGEQDIQLAQSDPNYEGAKIFQQRCSGCHTLSVAGTQGSAEKANGREYKDGPNFDQRKEEKDQILYAIENGGFSSGPMPQDIVVGEDAQKVADFLAKYSGRKGGTQSQASPPTGAQDDGE
jgi:mono/diheme cytochrome c family protein